MANETKNTYEGLFLFPQSVTANLQDAVDHINQLLERADAEVISMRKWDERKLAYEIDGHKRGVYFLVYFKAPAENMQEFDRYCNLSEMMLRAMMLRAEHIPGEVMEAAEGRTQLEDEIRLRSEQGAEETESAAGSAVVSSRSERDAQKAEAARKQQPEAETEKPEATSEQPEPAVAGASEKSES